MHGVDDEVATAQQHDWDSDPEKNHRHGYAPLFPIGQRRQAGCRRCGCAGVLPVVPNNRQAGLMFHEESAVLTGWATGAVLLLLHFSETTNALAVGVVLALAAAVIAVALRQSAFVLVDIADVLIEQNRRK